MHRSGKVATLQNLLGYILYPITLLLGIREQDRIIAGGLIGEKTILNEFVAYTDLATKYVGPDSEIEPKTQIILSYALCGFANFSSIGIQIAGIGGLAPKRRSEIAGLALKALLAATLTCFFTASMASIMFEPTPTEQANSTASIEQPATQAPVTPAPAETPVSPETPVPTSN